MATALGGLDIRPSHELAIEYPWRLNYSGVASTSATPGVGVDSRQIDMQQGATPTLMVRQWSRLENVALSMSFFFHHGVQGIEGSSHGSWPQAQHGRDQKMESKHVRMPCQLYSVAFSLWYKG